MTEPAPDALLQRLDARLSPADRDALDICVRLCEERGVSLFLVGGAVRDLLLQRDNLDLDLAVEAEVAPIAMALAEATGGRAVLHDRFGTATVRGPGFHLDLARTRRETYDHPGALPIVEPATLAEDLARRDFTINAIAVRLTSPAGELVDPQGGLADLKGALIRVLHERSFQDDATRMLRAVRYAARLGFKIQPGTEALIRRDLDYLDTISGPRLRRELTLIFEDHSAADAAALAHRLGVLESCRSLLIYHEWTAARWREAIAGPDHYGRLDQLGFCVLIDPYDDVVVQAADERLRFTAPILRALRDRVRLHLDSDKLASASPADAVEILDGRASVAVWTTGLIETDEQARDACMAYLERWRHVRPRLNGDDLLALGVPPGVKIGETLRMLRRAVIEGRAPTRDDEVELVKSEIGRKN
jgi:tRNA nucleotidyltransferase (CCA-adding enzyme)